MVKFKLPHHLSESITTSTQHRTLLQTTKFNFQLLTPYFSSQVYDTHMKENLMKIMALFPDTVFLRISLSRYIMQLAIKERNTKKHVENIIFFFDQMLRRFPDNYAEIPLDSLVVASTSLGQDVQHEISRRIQVSEGQANTLNYLI